MGAIVNIDQETKERIDNFVESLITDCENNDIAGMNLAVVHEGDILYTTGYGVKDLGNKPRIFPSQSNKKSKEKQEPFVHCEGFE